ncbi:hypothetical protein [Lysinibacillus parviboronicapiens]
MIRELLLIIPRKAGKSTLDSAIALIRNTQFAILTLTLIIIHY